MKVRQLVALLQGMEPDATVLLAFNRDYPFEYDVDGVAVRRDCADLDEESSAIDDGARPGDVLLTQGEQQRYGSDVVWDVAQKP
jgi:hypothetical protein